MKPLLSLLIVLLAATGYAQSELIDLGAYLNPRVKKDALQKATTINDLSPLLWSRLSLSSNDRYALNQRRVNLYAQPQPADYLYPQNDYKLITEVVFTEISLTVQGVTRVAQSTSEQLTASQKEILQAADMGSNVTVKLRFKYKDQTKDNFGSRNKVVEGITAFTIVPQTEAEYPGGFKQLSAYFKRQVAAKLNDKQIAEKLYQAVIRFTISADGQVLHPAIVQTTTDAQLDKLLLQAMEQMPGWKPSANAQGTKIKQEFTIPFSGGC